MTNITLDFKDCKTLGELHRVIKKAFDFPDYYGENLSALWDCLDGYCDFDILVSVKGLSSLPKDFDEYISQMREIFNKITEKNPNMTFRTED